MAREPRSKRVCIGMQPSFYEVMDDHIDNKTEYINLLVVEDMVKKGWISVARVQNIMQHDD